MGGDQCLKVLSVEVEAAAEPQSMKIFYFRKDDFTLAAIDETSAAASAVFIDRAPAL